LSASSFFDALALKHRRALSTCPAVGGQRLRGRDRLFAQRFAKCLRNSPGRLDLYQRVTIPFEKLHHVQTQAKDLVAVNELQKAAQGFDVKTVGDDSQFSDRPLQAENPKQARTTHDRQSIQPLAPESMIVPKGFKRLQKMSGLGGRIFSPESYLKLLHKMPKCNQILLFLRPASLCGHV